jgi:hypothetical protein
MPANPVAKKLKEAKFFKALVDTGGNAKRAYKATVPHVNDASAKVGGSRMLSTLNPDETNQLLEKVGCTKEAVLSGLWERMNKSDKASDYAKGVDIICKIGGFYNVNKSHLMDLMGEGLDLVEIVKIRCKRKDKKDLQQVIDVPSTSKDNVYEKS